MSSFFWGLNGVLVRRGLLRLRPIPGIFITLVTGIPVLLLFAVAEGNLYYRLSSLSGLAVLYLVLVAFFQYILGRIPVFTSISMIGASRAYTLSATGIPCGVAISVLLLKEAVPIGLALGVALNFVGISLVSLSQNPNAKISTGRAYAKGVLLALVGGLSYGIMGALTRAGVLETGAPIFANLVAASAAIPMYAAIILFLREHTQFISADRSSLVYLAGSGFLTTLALIAFFQATSLLPASVVVPIAYTYPLVTVIFSALFLGRLELVNWKVATGTGCVVLGTYMVVA